MSFQLVRASDDEIVIWHVDHGHIFVFQIPINGTELISGPVHDVADATERAETMRDAALRFATDEARGRRLIGARKQSRLRGMLSCDAGSL